MQAPMSSWIWWNSTCPKKNQSEVCAHTAVYVNTLDVLLPFRQKSAASPSDIHTFFLIFLSVYPFLFVCFSWFFLHFWFVKCFVVFPSCYIMYNMHIRNDFFSSFIRINVRGVLFPNRFIVHKSWSLFGWKSSDLLNGFVLHFVQNVHKARNYHLIPWPAAPKSPQYHASNSN